MSSQTETLLWNQPAWRAEAESWLLAGLDRRGLRPQGSIEQPHVRPWSTVLRVATTAGPVYFKAVTPPLAQEAGLTAWLAQRRPDCIPTVLGSDPARGWLLLADCGQRLREVLKANPDLSHWKDILPRYAALQIELAGDGNTLRELGVLDRSDAAISKLYESLISDPLAHAGAPEARLTPAEHARLAALTPTVNAEYHVLASEAVPLSLNHGDFHDGNIFLSPSGYIFFDWGDASLSHPFFSLRTAWVSLENTFGLEPGAPEFAALLDAYLEPWQRFASHTELLRLAARAARLAPLLAALAWQRALSAAPAAYQADYHYAIPRLLHEFLEGLEK
jgi:hypothetical protein